MATDPLMLFDAWFDQAKASEPSDPEAMALATTDETGQPSVRMVLLKDFGPTGFTFFTNLDSRKGVEIAADPNVALLFHWKSMRRQIRIEGPAAPVTDAEADAYFATRGRDSQLGAWASDQSRPLDSRPMFEARFAEVAERFAAGIVPRPPRWSGFRVKPERIEFWSDRPHRLHERRLFTRDPGSGSGAGGDGWRESLLYP